MRTQPLTLCEKSMIVEALKNGKRFDFRGIEDFRDVNLVVGAEVGTAICSIGQTKVMCAVSAQIAEPSSMRPHKGVINIDVDMSPMANLSNEHDRMGSKGMELTRLLELIIRDSRCIDVESLCIRAGKEIWKIRVDVRIMDEDGSVLDCACLAAITALQHYRRPNVTLEPHHTLVYSQYEKAPVPLNIYHMPICTTIGLLEHGKLIVIDPTEKESACLDGSIVVACNKRREVCALHQSTNLVLSTKQIEQCVHLAMKRAEVLTNQVAEVIKHDQRQRSQFKHPEGFATTVPKVLLTSGRTATRNIVAQDIKMEIEEQEEVDNMSKYQNSMIFNENPLTSGSVKQEDIDQDQMMNEQVEAIQKDVDSVDVSDDLPVTTNRKREVEEVDDLLADLEEEEEVVMTLGQKDDVVEQPVEQDDGEIVLKAKKKRLNK